MAESRCDGVVAVICLRRATLVLAVVLLALSNVSVANAQFQFAVQPLGSITCTATFVPLLLRAENLSARLGDSRLDCLNNGVYNPNIPATSQNMVQYVSINVDLTLNTAVTNKVNLAGLTEAILVVNDNNSYEARATSVLAGTLVAGAPACGPLMDAAPFQRPDIRYPCPQEASLSGPLTLTWNGILFPVPGAANCYPSFAQCTVVTPTLPAPNPTGLAGGGVPLCLDFFDQVSANSCFDLTTTLRFTNVRGNAAALGAGGTIIATLGVTAFASISVITNQGAVGIILPGLITSVVGDSVFQCTVGTNVVSVTLQEGFAAAFKELGTPGFANGDNTTENGYPVLTANSSGAPPQPVGATGGGASQATRFRIGFADVPSGVTLTMPNALDETGTVTVCMPPPPGPGLRPLCLQRVAGADANGRGGTLLEGPGSSDVPVVGGEAAAVYEIVSADPFLPQQITVDATFLCAPGSPQTNLSVTASLAPTSNVGGASFTAPTPRFIRPFVSPDLLVSALTGPAVGFVGGAIAVSATVENQSAALADPYQLGFYFSTDETITTADIPSPTACNSGGLAAGADETCTPSIIVPPALLPGPYFLGAIADDLGVVSESDETNNARVADSGSILLSSNEPPTADAGPDQLLQVAGGDTAEVTLDGSASSDPDSDPLTFTWTNSFGTVMGVMPTVALPAGVHVVTLTVDDGKGGTDTDTVEITVNQAPVADAGPNQVIQVPLGSTAAVTLHGAGSSDPDGDALTFTWTNSFGTAMGVMPIVALPAGVHVVMFTVDDGKGGTDTDTVEITVNQVFVAGVAPSSVFVGTRGGVFKSTNGGMTWTALNSGLTHLDVFSLAVDPTNPATVYAGGGGRVFKSTDGGQTWVLASNGIVLGLPPVSVTEIVIDPTNPSTIYAATGKFGCGGDGVFKSTDGAASWAPVKNGLPTAGRLDVRSLVIDPANPSTLYLTGVTGLSTFKTIDGGANWTPLNPPAFGFELAIDPADPATIYSAGPFGPRLVKSIDGGATWFNSNSGITTIFIVAIAIDPNVTTTLYAAASGAGVFKSTDGGANWAPLNTGLTTGFVPALAIDPRDTATVYAGTNSGVFRSTNGGASWAIAGLPDLAVRAIEITVNQAPVANAGSAQTVNVNLGSAIVTLDGSGSSDPDGDPLTFTWTGPFGTVGGVSPTVTLPGGVHTITLTVDDGRGGVDTDTVTVAVRALKLSSGSLRFLFGKSHGASQALSIRSVGGRVSYSIPRIASWLSTSPDRGESNGETDTIQVIVDPARRAGTYSANMIIRGNGNIMARIPVTMVVPEGGVPGSPMLRLPENPAVDVADFVPHGEPGHAMAGKSVIAIFGEGFVADGEFRADTVPLPTILGGVRVLFDGTASPLFLVTPGLIHAQLPMGLRGPTATLLITRDLEKAQSNPREIEIHDYSSGIFTLSQNGKGQGIITFANSPDLAAPVGTVGDSRPATAGDLLTIYANGMGPVGPPLVDGHNSCEPDGVCLPDGSNVVLHHTTMTPVIRIGGVEVPEENVLFSGSSPASVGVNEIVFEMPPGVPTGDAVTITIEIGGVVSKDDVTMAVK